MRRVFDIFGGLTGKFLRRGAPPAENSWIFEGAESLELRSEKAIQRYKINLLICASVSAAIYLLFALFYMLSPDSGTDALMRDEAGGYSRTAEFRVEAEYSGKKFKKDVRIDVSPALLTDEAIEERFDECEDFIGRVLEESGGPDSLAWGSRLPSSHEDSGVVINWGSECEDIPDEEGRLYAANLGGEREILLLCTLAFGGKRRELKFPVVLTPPSEEQLAHALEGEIDRIAAALGADDSGNRIALPSKSLGGAKLNWSAPGASLPVFPVVAAFLAIIIMYFSMFDGIKKSMRRDEEAVENELPNFSMQLVLMLNAGLVVESAFFECVRQNTNSPNPLYRILRTIISKSLQSNVSPIREFEIFCKNSRNRNLIRFSGLLAEHSTGGGELASKLEREGESLRNSRLQAAKGAAKRAETELTLPLMLLLSAVVIISIAPALLTM